MKKRYEHFTGLGSASRSWRLLAGTLIASISTQFIVASEDVWMGKWSVHAEFDGMAYRGTSKPQNEIIEEVKDAPIIANGASLYIPLKRFGNHTTKFPPPSPFIYHKNQKLLYLDEDTQKLPVYQHKEGRLNYGSEETFFKYDDIIKESHFEMTGDQEHLILPSKKFMFCKPNKEEWRDNYPLRTVPLSGYSKKKLTCVKLKLTLREYNATGGSGYGGFYPNMGYGGYGPGMGYGDYGMGYGGYGTDAYGGFGNYIDPYNGGYQYVDPNSNNGTKYYDNDPRKEAEKDVHVDLKEAKKGMSPEAQDIHSGTPTVKAKNKKHKPLIEATSDESSDEDTPLPKRKKNRSGTSHESRGNGNTPGHDTNLSAPGPGRGGSRTPGPRDRLHDESSEDLNTRRHRTLAQFKEFSSQLNQKISTENSQKKSPMFFNQRKKFVLPDQDNDLSKSQNTYEDC